MGIRLSVGRNPVEYRLTRWFQAGEANRLSCLDQGEATKCCHIDMALRPCDNVSSMNSRYGSQVLAEERPNGDAAEAMILSDSAPKSVITLQTVLPAEDPPGRPLRDSPGKQRLPAKPVGNATYRTYSGRQRVCPAQ
jgi:hypothetical protein